MLLALEQVHQALEKLAAENLLDEKLAEYAFFPLTHIFNQSRRLSSRGLEVAVRCVEILVSQGWRQKLLPDMAKQLLILMGLLVSQVPGQQNEPASDELKAAAFDCITILIRHSTSPRSSVFADSKDRGLVDQLVYQLLEAFEDSSSEQVQFGATNALVELNRVIVDRPLLASLLPRTVSTLVKVLRPSTQVRRTKKVLAALLNLLMLVLKNVFADDIIGQDLAREGDTREKRVQEFGHLDVLDKSWLDATTPQIDLALIQVVKLRTLDGPEVAEALLDLSLMVVEDCSKSLSRCIPLMVETVIVLCRSSSQVKAEAALRRLMVTRPEVTDILSSKFYDWSQALPRIMQGNDDKPKGHMLGQVTTSFVALIDASDAPDDLASKIASILVDSVSAAISSGARKSNFVNLTPRISPNDVARQFKQPENGFKSIILSHQSQQSSTEELRKLVISLRSNPVSQSITRSLVECVRDPDVNRRLSATWLALQFLGSDDLEYLDINELIDETSFTADLALSRPLLISDLYSLTVPTLLSVTDSTAEIGSGWQLVALSLECLILQASQLGESYRPELVETLFPILSFLGSSNAIIQQHAITALNLLSSACEYESASQMLIENVDYLINAIALRLNAFDVSQDSLQVLAMMIQLCGARLLPHLDDLIGSIFGALDNFHGYPNLVEHLFEILKMVVLESSKAPAPLAIELTQAQQTSRVARVSQIEDILNDLRARQDRKKRSEQEDEAFISSPRKPWTAMEGDAGTEAEASLASNQEDQVEEMTEHRSKEAGDEISTSHQLLINIAQSAVPHMSSPSARVRHTLLELLQELCVILSPHENTFLPLVNSIWPAISSRLFSKKDQNLADVAYNVRAAADTVSIICQVAGGFMTSRVEGIFADLEELFMKTYSTIGWPGKQQGSTRLFNEAGKGSLAWQPVSKAEAWKPVTDSLAPSLDGTTRTSNGQVFESLVALLVAILQNVQVSEDSADRVIEMLAPLKQKEMVRAALARFNEDALWLMENDGNE